MKPLIFILTLLFLFNCGSDAKKSKIKDSKTKKTNSINKKNKVTDSIIKPEFPILNDSIVMDFYLQYEKENKENKVRLTTNFGDIEILLFDKTKFHRANFIYLTKRKAFDGTQFHRVVKDFIIQGGNSDDTKVLKKRRHIGRYLLPNDAKRGYKHYRGMVSMPSSDIENPYKLASPYEFFIVQKTSHHLNGDYTIFGKVIKGMDVVDKINAVEADNRQWPLRNVYIRKAEIIK